ncbi:hypothetical protein BDW71DRAFT_202562 [Aspergillus fruticulosus]
MSYNQMQDLKKSVAKTRQPDDKAQCVKEELQTVVQNLEEFALVEEPTNKAFVAGLPIFQDGGGLHDLGMGGVRLDYPAAEGFAGDKSQAQAGGAVSGDTLPAASGKDVVGEEPTVYGSEARLLDSPGGEDGQPKGKSDDQSVKQTLEEQPIRQAISTSSANNAQPAHGESPKGRKIPETDNTLQDIAEITNTALATADKI